METDQKSLRNCLVNINFKVYSKKKKKNTTPNIKPGFPPSEYLIN